MVAVHESITEPIKLYLFNNFNFYTKYTVAKESKVSCLSNLMLL